MKELNELEERDVIVVLAYNSREKVVGFYLGFMTTENKTNEVKITLQGNLVYVLPSERRSGFGKNMNCFFQKAFETKVAELKLPNGAKVTVQRWVVIFYNNKIAMKFWEDQGYNKGESFYVDIHDYNQIVENYKKKLFLEKSLATIKKEKVSPQKESSRIVDEDCLLNKLNFSENELAAIETCPSIVKKYGWKKIKHFYGFTCFIPPYYDGYNFSVPNPSYEENKHFFKCIEEIIKHLRRYGTCKPKIVDHLKKDLEQYGYNFEFTRLRMQKGPFAGKETVWTRKCSFKGRGWEKKFIDGKECIQRNNGDPLFLGKDYFFDIKQVADYIINNPEAEGPRKEDLVDLAY